MPSPIEPNSWKSKNWPAREVLFVVGVSAAVLYFFARYVPFAMDEFCQQHVLATHSYPLNMLNQFRESATMYDLAPVRGHYLPLRSFWYIGSFHSLLYYPLFKLWFSPHSHRLLGIIMLLIQAFLLHRLFNVRWVLSFLALVLLVPYSFMHVVDTGTVSFQITSVFLICYLTRKWLEGFDLRQGWAYPFFIGVAVFLGIWTKLLYVALLPGVFSLMLYYFMENKNKIDLSLFSVRKKVILFFGIVAGVATVPTFILFNSADRHGSTYIGTINNGWLRLGERSFDFRLIFKPNLVRYFGDPVLSSNMVLQAYDRGLTWEGFIFILSLVSFMAYGIWRLRAKGMSYFFVVLNIALACLTYALIALIPFSEQMHHLVLVFPFILLAMFHVISKNTESKVLALLLAVFFAVNVAACFEMTRLPPIVFNHPAKIKLNKLINEKFAKDHVIIVVGYGFYYIKALYGDKDQCVLYIDPFNNPEQAAKVKKIMADLKRKALFIGRNTYANVDFIKANFKNIVELKTDYDTGEWRIWYES